MLPSRTLKRPIELSGVGLHSGQSVNVRLLPSCGDGGISFVRVDLEGRPRVAATTSNLEPSARCTTLVERAVRVHTVEHLMAALAAAGIDQLDVEIDAEELPVAGGCSAPYVSCIEEAGVVDLEGQRPIYELKSPIYYSEGSTHLVALPADEYRVSYTLHYPMCEAIRSQYYSIGVDWLSFVQEVASCRTFAHFEELEKLRELGLIRGGSLESAVVVKDGEFVTEGGLRFEDEPVRHKVLDLIGDLALIGRPVRMHVIALCSGHRTNGELAKRIYNYITQE